MPALLWVGSFLMTGLAFTGVKSIIGDAADSVTHPYEAPNSGIDTKNLILIGVATVGCIIAYKKLVK